MTLKQRTFNNITMIQAILQDAHTNFKKFHFKQWCDDCGHCVESRGDYFEGNIAY